MRQRWDAIYPEVAYHAHVGWLACRRFARWAAPHIRRGATRLWFGLCWAAYDGYTWLRALKKSR